MNRYMRRFQILTLIVILVASHACKALDFDRDLALNISQDAIDQQLDNYQFHNTDGATINLADYRGKPLIVSLIYTNCHDFCPITTEHLADVVSQARGALGADSFNVVSIGFDVSRDTPIMMRRFRDTQQVRDENWQFLSSDADTMQRLSRQLGFFYQPSSGGFDHQIQASLITPEGKVTQQVYGMYFAPPLLVEPLKRLIFSLDDNPGFFKSISNHIRLFSIVYDPYKNIYYFDYSIFIKFSMGLSYMSVIGIFLFREWRKTNRSRKRSA